MRDIRVIIQIKKHIFAYKSDSSPKVFEGQYITLTRRADGSLRPNFKKVEIDANFNIERYARGVSHEPRLALRGLLVRRGSRV